MLTITDNIYKLELAFGIRSYDLETTAIDSKHYLDFRIFRLWPDKVNILFMHPRGQRSPCGRLAAGRLAVPARHRYWYYLNI